MIDANAVVAQVRAGAAPLDWEVLPARRSHFITSAFGWGLMAALAAAAAFYLFSSGTIVGIGVNDQTPDNVAFFWFIVDMLVLAAILVAGIVLAIMELRALGTLAEQMLVVLPEGFVQRRGRGPKATTVINFRSVTAVVPTVTSGRVYLLMQRADNGRSVHLQLDGRFGKPKAVAEQIAAMYDRFAAARKR